MKKTDLFKSLQLFAGGEDVAIDSLLDLLGDHGDITANMSDEAAAMLVVASRLENISQTLDNINGTLISMNAAVHALGACVGYEPPRQGYTQSKGRHFLQIGGSVDTETY